MKKTHFGKRLLAAALLASTLVTVAPTAASAATRKYTLKWNKVSGASYYQVQKATNRSFSRNCTTYKTTKRKKKFKLKVGRKYYFRVRAVHVNYNDTKTYTNWSSTSWVKFYWRRR